MAEIIESKNAPAAIGPYSQAVLADKTLYISGQLPIDPTSGAILATDIALQTEQSLKNIGAILKAAGYDYSHVVKTTVMLYDIDDFAAMNEVYARFFNVNCPARAAFAVKALPKGALVEIETVAYKD
jgi:2-iminobutanoate/2-iminopropanoate deaminase